MGRVPAVQAGGVPPPPPEFGPVSPTHSTGESMACLLPQRGCGHVHCAVIPGL